MGISIHLYNQCNVVHKVFFILLFFIVVVASKALCKNHQSGCK